MSMDVENREDLKLSNGPKALLLTLLLLVQLFLPVQTSLAWDAGTKSRIHNDVAGGENPVTILDTRPYWAKSTTLTNSGRVADCPAGYTNTGLTCYRGPSTISNTSSLANCPEGYTNMGLTCYRGPSTYAKGCTTVFKKYPCNAGYTDNGCFCGRGADSLGISSMTCPAGTTKGTAGRCYKPCPAGYTNNGETCGRGADSLGMSSMTCKPGELRLELSGGSIPRCYNPPVCPSGYEYWGFRCYITEPGVVRTAVSTVKMNVRQSGNTHLWIVNRAIELLKKSSDPEARAAAAKFESAAVKKNIEQGLWDGDSSEEGTDHVDYPNNMGTHFYNPTGKDWLGKSTSVVTYDFVEGSFVPIVGGIVGGVAGASGASEAAREIMFKNNKTCTNARECAKERIDAIGGTWNTDDSYNLGLALHYMTDTTQPMHASGFDAFKIPNNLHPHYEYYAAYVQGKFPVTNINWDRRWIDQNHDSIVSSSAARSNGKAPRLSGALHISGDAGIVTIDGFNGIDPYTGYNFYNDPAVEALTGEILMDAYQNTASYLYVVYKSKINR